MYGWIHDGGWGMWPILMVGLVLTISAIRYAWDANLARLRFVIAMSVLLAAAITQVTLLGIADVLNAAIFFATNAEIAATLSRPVPRLVSDHEAVRRLLEALWLLTRPGILGGAFMTLSSFMVAVGAYREGR